VFCIVHVFHADVVVASFVAVKTGRKEPLKCIWNGLVVKLPKECRRIVAGASVEVVREFIPYGKGRVLVE